MSCLEAVISLIVEGVIATIIYLVLAGPCDVPDGTAFGFALLFTIFANGMADISIRLKKKGI